MTPPRASRAPRFLARATPWFATRCTLMRPRRRVTRSAERSVEPSSMTMISAPAGSVSSKFCTVRSSSRPSLRLMATTLMLVLAGIRLEPDVAFELAHRKQQCAVAHRQAGQEPAATDLTQREAGGVEVADGERLADRTLRRGIELAGPHAPGAVALRDEIQEPPVRRPGRVSFQRITAADRNPGVLRNGPFGADGHNPDLRGVGRVAQCMERHPLAILREPAARKDDACVGALRQRHRPMRVLVVHQEIFVVE